MYLPGECYRSSTPKHQIQINQVQSTEETQSDLPGIDNTVNSELQLNPITCESTNDESETENTFSINMLQIENECQTPIEPNYYQNKQNFNNFENSDNTRNKTNYTEQELIGGSSTNNIHQNTAHKVQLPE